MSDPRPVLVAMWALTLVMAVDYRRRGWHRHALVMLVVAMLVTHTLAVMARHIEDGHG